MLRLIHSFIAVCSVASVVVGGFELPNEVAKRQVRELLTAPLPVPALSNAERFARGMPPLAPRYNVKRSAPIKRQGPSDTPETVNSDAAVSSGGFVANTFNGFGEYTRTTVSGAPAALTFTTTTTGTGPFNVIVNNRPAGAQENLGAVVNIGDGTLAAGSDGFAFLTATAATAPGAPPTAGDNSAYPGSQIESAIWYRDLNTNELYAQWVNPDLSVVRATILFQQDYFVITGDAAAFQATYGPAETVTFTLS